MEHQECTEQLRQRFVRGNRFRLSVTLTERVVTYQDGKASYSERDFTPPAGEPVKVKLSIGSKGRAYQANVSGNVATILEPGTLAAGVYDIEVTSKDAEGMPMRYMRRAAVEIVEATAEACIPPGVEFGCEASALQAYFYSGGSTSIVGLTDAEVTVVDGGHKVRFIFADGSTKEFVVRDGTGGGGSSYFDGNTLVLDDGDGIEPGGTTPSDGGSGDQEHQYDGSVDTALDPNSQNPVANSVVTEALGDKLEAGDIIPGTGVSISRSEVDGRPKVKISSTGGGQGGGGGAAVGFISDASEATAGDTIYFFSNSPSQGVGSYNTLLQEGSLTGTDGKTYVYHPGKLYHLYEDGSFIEIEPDAKHYVTYSGNKVYYNYEEDGAMRSTLCAMPRYGTPVLNSRIKYADTSDTAILMMSVSGPFFAETTDVTVRFDPNKVRVYRYENGTLTELQNNSVLRYTYADFHLPRSLRVVRRYSNADELASPMDTDVWMHTGAESVRVRVKFSAAKVFYKDGNTKPMSGVPGFNPATSDRAQYLTVNPDRFVVNGGANVIAVASGITVDRRRRNVFYAKIVSHKNNPTFHGRAYTAGTGNVYYSTLYNSNSQTIEEKKNVFLQWNGAVSIQCYMQDYRLGGNVPLDLKLYMGMTGDVNVAVSEIGVLTFSDVTDDDHQ